MRELTFSRSVGDLSTAGRRRDQTAVGLIIREPITRPFGIWLMRPDGKIDKSFVQDISTDPSSAVIVLAILAMSHSLRLQVVAKGVETPEQRTSSSSTAATPFQGYLFGRPMPIGDWGLAR